ncbi:Hypothetical predicted protein [Olea europaea subsp. europaea]|uniref:Uncharacterized protein n=1 Tax=Olea europaea subsp. europaea TaxID=158383 RepID=A0A8S0TGL3_OLEEU|nr:Hypothetical predicted protein [Olea europaea subsp. europaea]
MGDFAPSLGGPGHVQRARSVKIVIKKFSAQPSDFLSRPNCSKRPKLLSDTIWRSENILKGFKWGISLRALEGLDTSSARGRKISLRALNGAYRYARFGGRELGPGKKLSKIIPRSTERLSATAELYLKVRNRFSEFFKVGNESLKYKFGHLRHRLFGSRPCPAGRPDDRFENMEDADYRLRPPRHFHVFKSGLGISILFAIYLWFGVIPLCDCTLCCWRRVFFHPAGGPRASLPSHPGSGGRSPDTGGALGWVISKNQPASPTEKSQPVWHTQRATL